MAERSVVAALMRANLMVFGERDPERRRAAIAETYAADVAFSDAEATTTGSDALDARVAALQANLPEDARFSAAGPLYAGGDAAALAWALGPEGGPPVGTGRRLRDLRRRPDRHAADAARGAGSGRRRRLGEGGPG